MTDPEMPRLPALPRSWDDVPTPERPIQTGPGLRDVARALGPLRPGLAVSAGAMVGMNQVIWAAAEAEQEAARKALREQIPEAVRDRCVPSLLTAPYVEGETPAPSDFRPIVQQAEGCKSFRTEWLDADHPSTLCEDLEAAIEAVSDAPYRPVTRYRHPKSTT